MRLLVSVVDPSEVGAALAGGADIVDVKDPSRGPLGAPHPRVLRAVRKAAPAPQPVSAALGDTCDFTDALAAAAREAAQSGVDFVKVGWVGESQRLGALLRALVETVGEVGSRTRIVAVAYADALPDDGAFLFAMPGIAAGAGAHAVMLDTAVKTDGRTLLDHLQVRALARWADLSRAARIWAGCAGNLGAAEIEPLGEVDPDVVGVRGAACAGGRGGRVSAELVRGLRQATERQVAPSATTTSHASPAGSVSSK